MDRLKTCPTTSIHWPLYPKTHPLARVTCGIRSSMSEPLAQHENPADLAQVLRERAREIGFELVGIAPAVSPGGFGPLQDWLNQGFAGEMSYIARREDAYSHPENVLPGVRSVILVGLNYSDRTRPEAHKTVPSPPQRGEGTELVADSAASSLPGGKVAKYASGSVDYHDVLKKRLKSLAAVLHEMRPGCRTRAVVDTAPLLERDFARLAGLGWFGKNTMLINKREGSWLFLGALLTDVELPPDEPHNTAHCGTCTRCLEACPTDAFPEPYVLDATRCISYLTIELRDQPIPTDLRAGMGDWLFGCDVCQDVCPWNRKAPESTVEEFRPDKDLTPTSLTWLLSLSELEFRERFRKTPLFRPGRSGILRNAAIVAGNSGDSRFIPSLSTALSDADELVRGAAAWALGEISGDAAQRALAAQLERESSRQVREEIEAALSAATLSP
jgi:epoxyqueuosine reductase